MADNLKPEEKLKRVRARAQSFFEQFDAEEAARQGIEAPEAEGLDTPLGQEQLGHFLHSLNAQLKKAIVQVRETSQDLAQLAAEVREAEARLERGN